MGMQLIAQLCLVSAGFEKKDIRALQDPSLEIPFVLSARTLQSFIKNICREPEFQFHACKERSWQIQY